MPPPIAQAVAASHIVALQRYRRKFGQSWHQCGAKKNEAKQRPPAVDAEAREQVWASMVRHRLFAFRHHQRSQVLKEIAAIRRAER